MKQIFRDLLLVYVATAMILTPIISLAVIKEVIADKQPSSRFYLVIDE